MALASAGPDALPRLTPAQFARLQAELERGPLAHGFAAQRWTLMRIQTAIGRMFHFGYPCRGCGICCGATAGQPGWRKCLSPYRFE